VEHLESVIQLAQECLEGMPAIVLGSGASAPYGIAGMGPLKEHLLENVTPSIEDNTCWDAFKASLAKTGDLEQSLQEVSLSPTIVAAIVKETRALMLADDLSVFAKVVANPRELALSRLFRHLFNSTHTTLSVVTTNYDRLAEYAADAAHFAHDTGFTHGYFRFFSPERSALSRNRRVRTVAIWKVHGSVDWFVDQNHVANAITFQQDCPPSLTPLIVTPGTTKYEETHREPFRTIITNADSALERGTAYFCVGYGFNDIHIQPKLVERVRHQATPIVILAQTLTKKAREFLKTCHDSSYLALEQSGTATKAYFQQAPDGVVLPDVALWDLARFLDATIANE
jgi:SIR2-like domain